jgi:3-oxoadipate enol-lactonase
MSDLADVQSHGFAWRECGQGSLVILLHGLGGSRISWDPQLEALGQHHRVAAWDLPGYGDAAPLDDQPVTFRGLADAAARWIERLGGGPAHVVGISMGGMIAQYLTAWHPASVRSLTLLSTSPAFGLDGTMPDVWKADRLTPLDQGLQPADMAERVLRKIAGPDLSPEAYESQRAAMARISATALRSSVECIVSHDSRPLLASIDVPTMVMVGSLDGETPPSYAEHLASSIPGAALAVVPGVGHLLNAEAPDAVNELILSHLDRVESAS